MKVEASDQSRFKQIVRGKIRQNLRKYVTHGEMIGRKGRDLVSIPIAAARRARISATARTARAASARAKAKTARPSASGDGEQRDGEGQAGSDPGAHVLEVEVTLEELAADPGRRAGAAAHRAQGQGQRHQEKARYTSIRRSGPESLRHFKRTYMQALRRQISSNTYDADDPRDRADSRGQALSLLDQHPAAASQRRRSST